MTTTRLTDAHERIYCRMRRYGQTQATYEGALLAERIEDAGLATFENALAEISRQSRQALCWREQIERWQQEYAALVCAQCGRFLRYLPTFEANNQHYCPECRKLVPVQPQTDSLLAETFSATGYHIFVQPYTSEIHPHAFVVSLSDGSFTDACIISQSLDEAISFMRKLAKETESWEAVM
jgi:hypothetical protein